MYPVIELFNILTTLLTYQVRRKEYDDTLEQGIGHCYPKQFSRIQLKPRLKRRLTTQTSRTACKCRMYNVKQSDLRIEVSDDVSALKC